MLPTTCTNDVFVRTNRTEHKSIILTSVIIQEFFGGTIHRINVNDNETHYFNMINGNIVDFTKEQFDIEGIKIKYKPNELVSRDKILSNKNTKERYDILKKYLRMM